MGVLQTIGWTVAKLLLKGEQSRAIALIANVNSSYGMSAGGSGLTFQQAVQQGFKSSVWVYRCIFELGQAIGSVPWKAFRDNKDGTETAMPGHPLELLMERPNPYTNRNEFIQAWASFLSLSGNAYWEIVKVDGKPKHLYALRPDWVKPLPDELVWLKGYEMDNGKSKKVTFPPEDILHFRYVDPTNDYVGCSPIAAGTLPIQTDAAAARWNKMFLDNAAVPGGILNIPGATVKKGDRARLRDELKEEFGGENLHRPMVLWGGMKWEKMQLSHHEMEFLKQRQVNKFEICALFGIPPQLVGANEDPTYANYEIARMSFWEDTVIPMLDWLQSKVNMSLAPYYEDNVVMRYDISNIPAFRKSFKDKVDTSRHLYNMGVPLNDINARLGLGLKDYPWGSIWWAPMNLMPIDGTSTEEGTATPEPGEGEDEEDVIPNES